MKFRYFKQCIIIQKICICCISTEKQSKCLLCGPIIIFSEIKKLSAYFGRINSYHLREQWAFVIVYMFVSQLTLVDGITLIVAIEYSKGLNHTYRSHFSSQQTIIHKTVPLDNFYTFL